jgi:hypothetical protein
MLAQRLGVGMLKEPVLYLDLLIVSPWYPSQPTALDFAACLTRRRHGCVAGPQRGSLA